MSIFSDISDALGSAVSGVTSAAGYLWHGAGDFVSSDQEQAIAARYGDFQTLLAGTWPVVEALQAIQQELMSLSQRWQPAAIAGLEQQLSALGSEVARNVAAPQTLSGVSKIFPGGLTFYLRGKELAEQNAALDTAFATLSAIRSEADTVLRYYIDTFNVFFNGLVLADATSSTAVAVQQQETLAVLDGYRNLLGGTPESPGELDDALAGLGTRWRAVCVALALDAMSRQAAAISATAQAASARRFEGLGVDPTVVQGGLAGS